MCVDGNEVQSGRTQIGHKININFTLRNRHCIGNTTAASHIHTRAPISNMNCSKWMSHRLPFFYTYTRARNALRSPTRLVNHLLLPGPVHFVLASICFYISTKFSAKAVEFKIMYYLRSRTHLFGALFYSVSGSKFMRKHIINLNNISKVKLRQHFLYILFLFVSCCWHLGVVGCSGFRAVGIHTYGWVCVRGSVHGPYGVLITLPHA